MEYAGDLLTQVHVADSFDHRASSGMRYIINPPARPPGSTSTSTSGRARSTGTPSSATLGRARVRRDHDGVRLRLGGARPRVGRFMREQIQRPDQELGLTIRPPPCDRREPAGARPAGGPHRRPGRGGPLPRRAPSTSAADRRRDLRQVPRRHGDQRRGRPRPGSGTAAPSSPRSGPTPSATTSATALARLRRRPAVRRHRAGSAHARGVLRAGPARGPAAAVLPAARRAGPHADRRRRPVGHRRRRPAAVGDRHRRQRRTGARRRSTRCSSTAPRRAGRTLDGPRPRLAADVLAVAAGRAAGVRADARPRDVAVGNRDEVEVAVGTRDPEEAAAPAARPRAGARRW